jgi:tripartite-type tricarboxylate transporter receptor subunit TctC
VGIGYSVTSLLKNIEAGQLLPLVILSKERHPKLPNTPSVYEADILPGKESMMEILIAGVDVGRLIMAPPDMPPATAAFLEQAVGKALQDKELVDKIAKERKEDVMYLNGAKTKELLDKVAKIPAATKTELNYIIMEKYY